MDKEKVKWYSSLLKLVRPCFYLCRSDETEEGSKAACSTGPGATIVAASKHFSSAHKVTLG